MASRCHVFHPSSHHPLSKFSSPCVHRQISDVFLFTDQINKLEDDRKSLQSAKAGLEDECKTLRQKVEILNELYQQKEMALQK